ncbi:alpha/beta hydrolase [Patescibacteria group bacterium]|nr:alpha/beta hydrolase [Patescibacteria group bacterium]
MQKTLSNFLKLFVKIFVISPIVLFPVILPQSAVAATIPYAITTGIPGQPITPGGATFLTVDFNVDYQSGQIFFSGNPDGTGNTWVDDAAIVWVVKRPDGTSASVTYRYDNGCAFISQKPPQNVTSLFKPGINQVQVKLYDICGWYIGSSPLYLVNTNAPEPQPSKIPLILIPGIGGSELKVEEDTFWNKDDGHGGIFNHVYPKDGKVWVNEEEAIKPGHDDYFDVLRMKTDGVNSEANLGLTGNLYSGAYQGAIDFFTSDEVDYTLNQNFFVFPYDWRKDIATTKDLLDQKIQEIKTQTGAQKVDIVAHSMGGLVARNYIADAAEAQNVRKLFTLGTPHLGSPYFLKALRYGVQLDPVLLFGLIKLAPSAVNDVVQNLISGFQLAPSQNYFNFYSDQDNSHPYPYRTELGSLNYLQIKNLLTSFGHNTMLFNPAESFHILDNSLSHTNGVDVTIITGSGQPTVGQIIELKTLSLQGNQDILKETRIINGDETVPLFSASINDPKRGLFLNGPAQVFYTNQKHGNLVTNGPALNLIKNILNGLEELPEGTSIQPYPLPLIYRIFSVHSPINIHVYDQNGNHTGPTPDGDFEVNIPGSSYDTLDDAKFVYLPEEGIYHIVFESTGEGSFDFKIRKFENDENTETILYKDVPLTNSTTAETTFDTNSNQAPIIEVDENGDGTSEFNANHFSILEGNSNYDYDPPVISFDVTPKSIWPPNNKMVDINIMGTISDENPYITRIMVDDEYDLVEPSITIQNQTYINQTIQLEASRKGEDKDGRKYTIKILVTDLAGNTSLSTAEVIIPHDQGKKK